MTEVKRFDNDAETLQGAYQYLINRSKQLLLDDYKLIAIIPLYDGRWEVGARAEFVKNHRPYYSFYILKNFRGRRLFQKFCSPSNHMVVTTPDCNLEDFLKRIGTPHIVTGRFSQNHCYKLIEKVYGNTRANRSKLFYMNHIDEGLAILKSRNCDIQTMEAFCLHPILQVGSLFQKHFDELKSQKISQYTRILATEYAEVANEYLSPRKIVSIDEIRLSHFDEVNEMLVADKIQNRKDFRLFKNKYGNAEELEFYFDSWLKRLSVSEEEYRITIKNL